MAGTADARMQPARVTPRMHDRLTVEGAIDRLADAAQSMVADQLEVARLDVKVVGGRMLRSAALLIVAALMLLGSWTALTLAVYVALASELSPEQRLGLVALAHALLGLGLLFAAARVMKGDARD
jgi:hypothetical protein